MDKEPYNVLEKGDVKIFKKNPKKTQDNHPDLLPVGYDGEIWQTIKLDSALLEKIVSDKGIVQVAIYVQDDGLKVIFKPKWVNPNPKTDAGGQAKEGWTNNNDAPAIADNDIDDEIPF
jgi:hypothetical protein|tara:strand:+ start:1491 stop:1844 length:354 start_codon:yes stop_codon:yes gene_type:complete